jgi:hypothetical protein
MLALVCSISRQPLRTLSITQVVNIVNLRMYLQTDITRHASKGSHLQVLQQLEALLRSAGGAPPPAACVVQRLQVQPPTPPQLMRSVKEPASQPQESGFGFSRRRHRL